jgi:hypothetical protein
VNTISGFKSYCRNPEKDLTMGFSGDRYVVNNLNKNTSINDKEKIEVMA